MAVTVELTGLSTEDGGEMRRTIGRSLLILLLLLLLAVSLVGCGDSAADGAPDFSLTDANGGSVSLADYDGTPVLLFFHMADG
jgi:cytochrome oxidase Cu insertion factor (SCO1/SenC/PrrC family)